MEVEVRNVVEAKTRGTRFRKRSGRITGRGLVLKGVVDGAVVSGTVTPGVEDSRSGCAAVGKNGAVLIVEREEIVFEFVVDPVAIRVAREGHDLVEALGRVGGVMLKPDMRAVGG